MESWAGMTDWMASLRLEQWYKNLVILAAPLFSKQLFDPAHWPAIALAFFIFGLASSGAYLINDVLDAPRDRVHPAKRSRPIAAGRITPRQAVGAAVVLLLASAAAAALWLPPVLAPLLLLILLMQAYNLGLKNAAYLDVALIASNFLLRGWAGAEAVSVPMSPWFLSGIFCAGLFLSVGKRLGDLDLMNGQGGRHKAVLTTYSRPALRRLMVASGAVCLVIYTLFVLESTTLRHDVAALSIPVAFFLAWNYTGQVLDWRGAGSDPLRLMLKPAHLAAICIIGLLLLSALLLNP